ncbi:hypothetical protein [Alteribacillus bidgolensis]|uniref:Uncharacterized protein n=1 Tax=Alteribacillus bidgolensis TaxID=930129 RepID=A0A1G8QRC6_9BACI|nr:hypothetical protein [Alteribacillus bidgolensis]SDJ07223.1 hypothetical protein SAMN05216352_12146 [Alteribacillus bidgolensis]
MDFLYLNIEKMIKAGVLNMDKCIEKTDESFNFLEKEIILWSQRGVDHGITYDLHKRSNTGANDF